MKQRHFLYRTTNVLNGTIYVGIHSSCNIETDSYLGSGVVLKQALKKYGRKNFIREILEETSNRAAAEVLEANIVTRDFCKLATNYNTAPGGRGGCGKLEISFEERSKRWKKALLKLTPEQRKLNGKKSGNAQKGRTKESHPNLGRGAILRKIRHGERLSLASSAFMSNRWANNRPFMMAAVEKAMVKLRGRTKENNTSRLSQSIKISGKNNVMKRQDILDKHFIGKTKDNCEWRARQAITVAKTQAFYSTEKKLEISKKLSNAISGTKNGMHGKIGELSPVAKYKDSQKREALNLFQAGVTRKIIAQQLEVNYQTIKSWIRDFSYPTF